ncbi:muscarinic acetylcholine receptor M2-like [Glandiceps talaboti]
MATAMSALAQYTNTTNFVGYDLLSTANSSRANSTTDVNMEYQAPYSLPVIIILAVILTAIILVTIIGNTMVIVAFATDYKLRLNVSNFFLLNLACADFMIGLLSLPLNSAWMLYGRWPFGEVVCKVWICVDFVVCYESVCAIILISLDRYWLVSKKYYLTTQTRKNVFLLCLSTWIFSVMLFVPLALGWTAFTGERNIDYYEVCEIESWENLKYNIAMIVFEFFLPLFTLAYLNLSIYIYIRRRAKKLQRLKPQLQALQQNRVENAEKLKKGANKEDGAVKNNVEIACKGQNETGEEDKTVSYRDRVKCEQNDDTSDSDIANGTDDETAPSRNSSRRSVKEFLKGIVKRRKSSRLSSMRRHQRHKKAAKRLSVLVIAFVICWAPYKIMSLVNIVCDDCFNMNVWDFVNYLLWCNSTVNPLLYAFCNLIGLDRHVVWTGIEEPRFIMLIKKYDLGRRGFYVRGREFQSSGAVEEKEWRP